MTLIRRIEPGRDIDAYCTRCKRDFTHTVLSMAGPNVPERVRCNTCGSEHRYLPVREGGQRPIADRAASDRAAPSHTTAHEPRPPERRDLDDMPELTSAIHDLIARLDDALPATTQIGAKWQGGTVVLRPGRPGLQEKEIPIDALFRKIVMIRDRLRVLEQQINSNATLQDAEKLSLQQYITRCYGSLTTFNVLFDDRDDWFVGEKKSD